jgi:hypothetical protein
MVRLLAVSLALFAACHTTAPARRPTVGVFNIREYGAVGDGSADDTDAIEHAVRAACQEPGGTVYLPPGVYRFVRSVRLVGGSCSNLVVRGEGASSTLLFFPTGVPKATFNDRAFYIESTVAPESTIRQTAIAAGAVTIELADRAIASGLRVGQWLVVSERDRVANEIVAIDWVQIDKVASPVVELRHPFRTDFGRTRGSDGTAIEYRAVTGLLHDVELRDFRLVQGSVSRSVAGITVGMALRTRIRNVLIDNARGNGFAIYRAKDVSLDGIAVVNAPEQANEIAASVDVRMTNSTLGFERTEWNKGTMPSTAVLNIDFGTAFFAITGNSLNAAGNIAVMMLEGVHDGVFASNSIGWVRDAGIGLGQGLSLRGAQRVIVRGNSFAGGDRGQGNTCIGVEDSKALAHPIPSADNSISDNSCPHFAR